MTKNKSLGSVNSAIYSIWVILDALFGSKNERFSGQKPVIEKHIEDARRAVSLISLVHHSTAAYAMIMTSDGGKEHIENIMSEGSFEGYLLLLRDVADEPSIREGLAYSYGSQAAEDSFVNQSNMYLRQVKKISSSPLCDRFFGAYGNRKIPSEQLLRQIIAATSEDVEKILQKLPPV